VYRILADFPKEVREAVPVLAQQAELPSTLLDLVKKDEKEYIQEILAKQPKDIQAAGQLLCRWPEVLELMALHTNLMRMVGDIYKKDGLTPLQNMVAEVEGATKPSEDAVTLWSQRLQGNPVALQQYLDASAALMQEKTGAAIRDYGFGVTVNPTDNVVTVYALPVAPLARYALIHADLYPQLADEMLEQWIRTNSRTDFDDVMRQAYNLYHQLYLPDFFQPDGRAQRLREAALLAKRLGREFKPTDLSLAVRAKFLQEHVADFPQLQKFLNQNLTQLTALNDQTELEKPRVPAKRAEPGTTALNNRPRSNLPNRVVRGNPSYGQQVRRGALASDYYLNNLPPQGGVPASSGLPLDYWVNPQLPAQQLPWWYTQPLGTDPANTTGTASGLPANTTGTGTLPQQPVTGTVLQQPWWWNGWLNPTRVPNVPMAGANQTQPTNLPPGIPPAWWQDPSRVPNVPMTGGTGQRSGTAGTTNLPPGIPPAWWQDPSRVPNVPMTGGTGQRSVTGQQSGTTGNTNLPPGIPPAWWQDPSRVPNVPGPGDAWRRSPNTGGTGTPGGNVGRPVWWNWWQDPSRVPNVPMGGANGRQPANRAPGKPR
jgi:hypothetical protein